MFVLNSGEMKGYTAKAGLHSKQSRRRRNSQDEGRCATVSEDGAEELQKSLCKGQEEKRDSKHCLRTPLQ